MHSEPDLGLQIEKMQPVRSDMKLDGLTWPKMFLTFIFANDLAESSIAREHSFMPHGFNDRDIAANGNVTFGRLSSTRKIHMLGPKAEMNPPTLRDMAVGKRDRHTAVGHQNSFPPRVADLASGKMHCR